MAVVTETGLLKGTRSLSVPPLESGDNLSAAEFLRRFQAEPHIKKAELVRGIVFMASPVHALAHARPDSLLQLWLGTYAAKTPDLSVFANPTVELDDENVVQPDALLRLDLAQGGRCRVTEEDYLAGTPELVIEVAATSASLDAHDKKAVYRRFGVREYLLWRTWDEAFDWFVLENGSYQNLQPDGSGVLRSPHFAGLWLNLSALLKQDAAQVLTTLEEGLKARG
jgi:Uma2 family endonuclease